MKVSTLKPVLAEFIPERLEDGFIYISEKYRTASHRCCCGCGQEVVTPLTPADWSLYVAKSGVTLYPSIGNWGFACQSHYWIRRGQIIWGRPMSTAQIARVRARDCRDKEKYLAEINLVKEVTVDVGKQLEAARSRRGFFGAVWVTLRGYLRVKRS